MRIHKLRFHDNGPGAAPGRYRKAHQVTDDTFDLISADVKVVWTDSIDIYKGDIEFLMESEG